MKNWSRARATRGVRPLMVSRSRASSVSESRLTLTDEGMAVAAEVLLLVALLPSIHAQVIQKAGRTRSFILDGPADFCSVSRWTGEEKALLWNSSGPHDSSQETHASFKISSLKVSDSGQYQEQCWTRGNLTHQRNSTLLVCDTQKMKGQRFSLDVGQTVELTCDGAGPNQSVQWASEYRNRQTKDYELALVGDASPGYKLQLVSDGPSLLVTAHRPLGSIHYFCLERSRQRCDLLGEFFVNVLPEYIHRSLGESLALNCSGLGGNQPHVWTILNSETFYPQSHKDNTLMFPSLMLDHTGLYTCNHGDLNQEYYYLYVCPESGPPAEVSRTAGENVTLPCGDSGQRGGASWFVRSNRTEGRVSRAPLSDPRLVITDVSVEDSGEYRCVIVEDRHCVFTSQTLLTVREPELDHRLVRSVLVSAAITVMCVAVAAVVWSTRSREQLPVPVEEEEEADLSPASAELQLET